MKDLTDVQRNHLQTLANHTQARRLYDVYVAHGKTLKFAGGCVRDALLDISVDDIDLATDALPQDGIRWLDEAGIVVKPTGIAHGTITAIIDQKPYEITTLRQDVKTDGRHAEVVFGTSWERDAQRRDFTINGLFCDFTGQIEDYVGGLVDLDVGRIRFIGNAVDRCREDYLRILRLFRFWTRFGKQPLDHQTLHAVQETVGGLAFLSKQRVWMEFKKLLLTERVADALLLMHDMDVLTVLLDNHYCKPEQVGALHGLEHQLAITPQAVRCLAVLFAYRTQTGWTIDWSFLKEHFSLSNKEVDYIRDMQTAGQASTWWTTRLMAAIATFNRDVVIDLCLSSVIFGFEKIGDFQAILPDLRTVEAPIFPVTATDLMERDYQPGPQLGAALNKMRDYWLETNCEATKEECLELL